ncbi:MAG: hypothetical protein GY943_18060 [Chloroflexi bacterium]|nr:hypothetical protein [Chloroflexota bacterium]
MQFKKSIIIVLLLLMGLAATIHALVLEEHTKLTPSDSAGNGFGRSVITNGEIIAVGASFDDDQDLDAGAVYIFHPSGSTWSEQTKLMASDGREGDGFGGKIAISGDTLVIGASGDDSLGSNSGAVYVFRRRRDVWIEQAKLTASDGEAYNQFGNTMAINERENIIVVGARGDDDLGENAGAAYVFQRSGSTWSEQIKLTASDGGASDLFGKSVAVDGNMIVVGAIGNADAAYVFQLTSMGWVEQAKLTPNDSENSCMFGDSVAIRGSIIVVGDFCADDPAGGSPGAVHIFQRNGSNWLEQARFMASDRSGDDHFGFSVVINKRADTIIVGAPLHTFDDNCCFQGAAYIIKRDGAEWQEQAKLISSDGLPFGIFGSSVAINKYTVVVGTHANSAYVFDIR